MLVVGFISSRYKYILWLSLFFGIAMNILQLISKLRFFSIVHILICLLIIVFMRYTFKYFRLLLKGWALLLIFSGGMVLLSTILYLLSGAINKISIEGNLISLITMFLGFYLFRYFEKSVSPSER